MSRETAVLTTLVIYKILLIAIGLLARSRNHSEEDFFLGGRGLGPVVAAVSASASSSSAWTLMGVSGAAYAWGLGAAWLFLGCVGGFALNWYVLAPRLRSLARREGAITVTDLLSGEASASWQRGLRSVAGIIVLLSLCGYVAAQFQGAGKNFAAAFDGDMKLSVDEGIYIGAAIVVFYTLLGGFWAVSLTDTLQGLVMAVCAVVLPVGALIAVLDRGGFVQGMRAIPQPNYLSFVKGYDGPLALGFVLGILGIGLGYPGQPHVVNRFMALGGGAAHLRKARIIAMSWALVVYPGMLLLGWCGRILHHEIADGETIFIVAANAHFHPVVAGVMLAAVLSAIMSTADSQLLVAASAVTHDMGLGARTQRSLLFNSRLVVLALSAGAVLLALNGSALIFNQVLVAWTALGCAFGPLLLVHVFGGRVAPGVRLACMLLGAGGSVFLHNVFPTLGFPGETLRVWDRFALFFLVLLLAVLGSKKPGAVSSKAK